MTPSFKLFLGLLAVLALVAGAAFSAHADMTYEPPIRHLGTKCEDGKVVAIKVAVGQPGIFTIEIDHSIACRNQI